MSPPETPGPVLQVRFYKTDTGAEPAREWLRKLPDDVRATIGGDLLRVQWGWPMGKPLVDSFGDGLFELRSTHDKKEYRLFFIVGAGILLALHGYRKTTKKTPQGVLDTARDRKRKATT